MWKECLCIALGGGGGAILRYGVQLWVSRWTVASPLFATTFVNLTGALLLGGLLAMMSKVGNFSLPLKLLLTTGFCGGYTTFSTFTAEAYALLQQGQWATALGYIGVNLVGCLLLFALAVWAMKS